MTFLNELDGITTGDRDIQVIKLLRNFIERGFAAPKKGNSYTIKLETVILLDTITDAVSYLDSVCVPYDNHHTSIGKIDNR